MVEGKENETNLRGIASKPKECQLCPLYYKGSGFVQDQYNPDSKILLIQAHPTKSDLLVGRPLTSTEGFAKRKIWDPVGLKREDFSFAYVLRCYPEKQYPIGKDKLIAERTCRQYDNMVIKKFSPTLFISTFGFKDVFETPSFTPLVKAAFDKARRFSEKGTEKVALLLGSETVNLLNPYLTKGGLKAWQGHFWKGEWGW